MENRLILRLFLTLCFIASSFCLIGQEEIVSRAAFDIGSGKIKMLVVDMDVKANKILNVLYTDAINVPLRARLAINKDMFFDEKTEQETINAIAMLQTRAQQFSPLAFCGIATESFRLARNGEELAARIQKELGIPITIVSQEEEGILGFRTALALQDIPSEEAIVWDIGGGSFQLVEKNGEDFTIFNGRIGKISTHAALLEIQGKGIKNKLSPNPISIKQSEEAIAFVKGHVNAVPHSLLEKIKNPSCPVYGIGSHPHVFFTLGSHYTHQTIRYALNYRLTLDDATMIAKYPCLAPFIDDRTYATYAVPHLILTYGIMDQLNIEKVEYVNTLGGNSTGLLLSPSYWNDKESVQQSQADDC